MEWPSPAFYPCLAHTWSLTSSRHTSEGRLGSLSIAKCGQRPRPVGSPPEPGLSGALAGAGAQGGVWKRPGQCGLKQWPHPGSNPHRLLDLGPGPASPAAKIQPGGPRAALHLHPGSGPSPTAILLRWLGWPRSVHAWPSTAARPRHRKWVGLGVERQAERQLMLAPLPSWSHAEPDT